MSNIDICDSRFFGETVLFATTWNEEFSTLPYKVCWMHNDGILLFKSWWSTPNWIIDHLFFLSSKSISHSLDDKSGFMKIFSGQYDLLDRILATAKVLLSLTKICLDWSWLWLYRINETVTNSRFIQVGIHFRIHITLEEYFARHSKQVISHLNSTTPKTTALKLWPVEGTGVIFEFLKTFLLLDGT